MIKLTQKYEVIFREEKDGYITRHLYGINGIYYPSVTSFFSLIDDGKKDRLSKWAQKIILNYIQGSLIKRTNEGIPLNETFINNIVIQAKKEPYRLAQYAGNVGTQCHEAIDEYIYNRDPHTKLKDSIAVNAFNNFISWFKGNNYMFIAGDTIVASIDHGYGGRLDALASKDNDIILLDWKTSSGIFPTYHLQVAGYAIALEEMFGIKPTKAFIIKFSKNSDQIEEQEVTLDLAKEAFINLVKLTKSYNLFKKDIEKRYPTKGQFYMRD